MVHESIPCTLNSVKTGNSLFVQLTLRGSGEAQWDLKSTKLKSRVTKAACVFDRKLYFHFISNGFTRARIAENTY